jgi:hypothetical protein
VDPALLQPALTSCSTREGGRLDLGARGHLADLDDGDPGATRTHGLYLRRVALYPLSYGIKGVGLSARLRNLINSGRATAMVLDHTMLELGIDPAGGCQ